MLKFGTQVVINNEFYSNIRGSVIGFCDDEYNIVCPGTLLYRVRIFHYESGEWLDEWISSKDMKAL